MSNNKQDAIIDVAEVGISLNIATRRIHELEAENESLKKSLRELNELILDKAESSIIAKKRFLGIF
jgi:hypothetical protein